MLDILTYTVPDMERITGIKHTQIYELIAQGKLDARKSGSRTLITAESVRSFIAGLPQATEIGGGKRRRILGALDSAP